MPVARSWQWSLHGALGQFCECFAHLPRPYCDLSRSTGVSCAGPLAEASHFGRIGVMS